LFACLADVFGEQRAFFDAISALFRVVNRYFGNLAPMPGGFPDLRGTDRPDRRPRPRARHRALGHAIVAQWTRRRSVPKS
jgi:hypothetical protein